MEMVIIGNSLQVFLIILLVVLVASSDGVLIAILFSLFSLFASLLFVLNHAPDVAMAEIAVGSAIMPLILIISISKQREFLVDDRVGDGFASNEDREGHRLLMTFTKHYNLNLKICRNGSCDISGVFRKDHVDLIIEKSFDGKQYLFKGKKSSILMNRLEMVVKEFPQVSVVSVEESEEYD
jgi:uncharacterized MnhB-related membrane protein